ncbi:MAG TPA: hypothetical protein VFV08_09070 [Puia sp.]|nr:hypothetical protein [Puia sp.]
MNNVFNGRRFGWLLKKTILERPSQIGGLIGLMLAAILITYFIFKTQFSFSGAQNIAFIWGLAGGGCFLASYIFNYFSTNSNGSSYLTLPASYFEKWLCGVLIAGVFYPILFLLFFRAMDAGFVALYHNSLDPTSPLYKQQYAAVYLFSFTGRIASHVYPIFFLFSGTAVFGSLYFNKAAFIKTALLFCAICLGLFALNWLLATIFFGEIDSAFPYREVQIKMANSVGSVELPEIAFSVITYFLSYFIPLLMWILALIRLSEKEF